MSVLGWCTPLSQWNSIILSAFNTLELLTLSRNNLFQPFFKIRKEKIALTFWFKKWQKNFLLFVFKTKLENLTKHYPTHLECLFLFTIILGKCCFLEFYGKAKGSEHQKSDKEEESASFLVVPSWLWSLRSVENG